MIAPYIDPIIFSIGPLAIRWYALAYVAGILIGIYYIKILAKKSNLKFDKSFFDDFLMYIILGIVLGGRIGYVLIYDFSSFAKEPITIFQTWNGGMSFHGGFLGFLIATILLSRKKKLNYWQLLDLAACAAPIGIFLGRIANFINRELIGRETNSDWGIIFPEIDMALRHPSQIYEATSEGILLFFIMNILFFKFKINKTPGILSAYFCIFYSIFRFISEYFREPDTHIGYLWQNLTMGQLVSILMMISGIIIFTFKYKSNGK